MTHEDSVREALRAHPISETVAGRVAKDPEYAEYISQTRLAMEPILRDLQAVGFKVEWLSELRQWKSWESAIPTLLHWLPLVHHRNLELDIIHCLAVPWTGNRATAYLIEKFKETAENDIHYAWAIGSALSKLDVKGFEQELIKLCRNGKYGRARQMIVYSLNRLRDPEAEEVALDLLEDRDVRLHAINALAQKKSNRALYRLEQFLSDRDPHIRKAARNAITKIMR